MIGVLSPGLIPLTHFRGDALGGPVQPLERMYAVACCGECGRAPGSPDARVCTRTDCGLSDRHFHLASKDAA